MTFQQAAGRQYRYGTYYTVFLCGPNGERENLGFTPRKTGEGLCRFIGRESVQERVKRFPDAESLTFKKHRDRLELSNGWVVRFGGTIRQEAE